ncbi:HD domain-containing protein [Rothia terrae]|jgi:HD superfamily phosphodiesterase|nr:HD domain-containing protein [Rothia terrae]
MMSVDIAGINIPDSALAREATELVRDTTNELIYHHSRRTYLFGAHRGLRDGLTFDAELLYIGAMFHDFGLVAPYASDNQRFEIDGADEARAFLLKHDIAQAEAQTVWTAIALHTTPEIPLHMDPVIALVTRGVEHDVMGVGYETVSEQERAEILKVHPRPDFKNQILQAFTEGIKHRPDTTFGNVKADVLAHFVPGFVRGDFVKVIKESPWGE